MVASWKYNLPHISEKKIAGLVKKMASSMPEFYLPPVTFGHEQDDNSTHNSKNQRADTYAVIDRKEQVQIIWPNLSMNYKERGTLQKILGNIHYFGRTKSWCSITLDNRAKTPNCIPQCTNVNPVIPRQNTEIAIVVSPKPKITMDDIYTIRDNFRKKENGYPEGSQVVPYLKENS